MLFDFEEGFALFDVTPLDNQFIQEYLPAARGDDVRVYLYGLMRCYHPEDGMSLERMSQELNMTEEDVLKAYRYWERRGLVQRVSDEPVSYRYVSLRRKNASGKELEIDPAYAAFADSLYGVFGNSRRLHGAEIRTCYEWVEDLGLPPETVIMLLKHMEKQKGKQFSIAGAQQMAMAMADEKIRTVEDAEEFLSRDQKLYQGTKDVLKRLGRRNPPSEDQVKLYRKWTQEWRFTPEAILAACEQTAGGDPSMGYLDAILRNTRENAENGATIDTAAIQEAREEVERLKKVLKTAGGGRVDEEKKAWYRGLEAEFGQEMILLAARECRGRPTEDIGAMLRSWQQKGIMTPEAARAYIREFRAQSETLRSLRDLWGLKGGPGSADRAAVAAWEKELGFSRDAILYAAEDAAGTEKPMAYLNRILRGYAEKGIRTREQMAEERRGHREGKRAGTGQPPAKRVSAQEYEQRDYSQDTETLADVLKRMEGAKEPDA